MKQEDGDVRRGRVMSPPTRGRGLKPQQFRRQPLPVPVAPHAGAWIETLKWCLFSMPRSGRPPRGGVD